LTYGVDLLPRHPIDAARAGATARIPVIIGTNLRDASLFARRQAADAAGSIAQKLCRNLP
jgi:carboxylesterase type B